MRVFAVVKLHTASSASQRTFESCGLHFALDDARPESAFEYTGFHSGFEVIAVLSAYEVWVAYPAQIGLQFGQLGRHLRERKLKLFQVEVRALGSAACYNLAV